MLCREQDAKKKTALHFSREIIRDIMKQRLPMLENTLLTTWSVDQIAFT